MAAHVHAGLGGGQSGVLRAQDDFVDLALARSEVAVHRQGAGDVAGVSAVGTGHVHHHHVAILHLVPVLIVVENGGKESRADDGRVRRPLAAAALKFILHQGGNLVFPHAGLYRLHGGQVRFHRSLHGLANQGDFSRTFHRAHAPDVRGAYQRVMALGALLAKLRPPCPLESSLRRSPDCGVSSV